MRRELPAGTVTFLFTDVDGSTKLLHAIGAEAYAAALAEHRLIVREACAAEDGVEVDTQGDAFFFAFPSAPGAVTAARAMTEALAAGPVQLRIGLHTGTPLVTEEGYIGGDVHLAARVAAAAHGGQVVLSRATRELLDGIPITDLGEHRLKDIERAVSIFQLGSTRFPPLKTISNTNLPRPLSSFVGRERERRELVGLLGNGTRLVTLCGPGGSGKTRLAVETAFELVPAFEAGVFWVGLAALRDPALLAQAIAQTLGADDGPAEHIGERELLLLLDNFEQLVAASPEVGRLLERCPNLKVLVTSRELLRIGGEVEYAVPPLAEAEAVELFCARSQLAPDEKIVELCRRLDELPLALELAAARTRVLSPAQILERLSQRLDLLKGGRDVDPRQQTLRATIEWSHDLLDEPERRLFARLAVFRGGCTLDAAEHVAEADVDALQSLVEKSLLRHTGERFWMLETIRTYARERLAAGGEEPDLRRRHALFVLDLLEATYRELEEGGDQAVCYGRIEADHDNMRAALEWARDARADEVLLRLAAPLGYFWCRRGYYQEADTWLPLALERASAPVTARMAVLRSASTLAAATRDYERSAAHIGEWRHLAEQAGDEHQLLMAMNSAALDASEQGQSDAARALFTEIERRARAAGDDEMLAFVAVNLGQVAWQSGDLRGALASYRNAAAPFRALGDDGGVVTALGSAGWCALGLSDAAQAKTLFHEALVLSASIGWRREVATNGAGLGSVLVALHEEERGAQLLGAAEAMLDRLGAGFDEQLQAPVHERAVADAKAALGEAAFATAWARGKGMTEDEIVAFAAGD